jgi:hypothetical protein
MARVTNIRLNRNPTMIVAILPEGPEIRKKIRYYADVIIGVRVQCVHWAKAGKNKNNSQYLTNVALK